MVAASLPESPFHPVFEALEPRLLLDGALDELVTIT